MELHLSICLLMCVLCRITVGDQALDPRGRNVCHLPRRLYPHDALRPYEWQLKPADDKMEYRCCDGWTQVGDSCPQAVCNTPCLHGYCAAPNFCLCDDQWTGPTCSKTCPVTSEAGRCVYECGCPSMRCNYPDGSCACPLGSWGYNCSVPCSPGYYGPNCLLQCHCEANTTCSPDTGSCMSPQNISTLPNYPELQVHAFRMVTLTGCGTVAVVALVSSTAYAFRKRRTRRVFNVRKRTMSMTPIENRAALDNQGMSIKSTPSFAPRGAKYQGYSVKFPGRSSTSYVGMKDLITPEEETNLDPPGRPISCLSTSTTISMLESLSESRDTIYEVHGPHVLDAWRNHEVHNPRYTNSSVFKVGTSRGLEERLKSIRGGVSVGPDSDSDEDFEYNYPYADLAMRLPGPPELARESRSLRPCSSDTEYVVVLNQDLNTACFTPEPNELGFMRERPAGLSFITSAPASSDQKALPSPGEGSSTESQIVSYQVPRSPPIQRFLEAPCDIGFVRGYVTTVKNSSSLRRGSAHRQTRRLKSETMKCPPPPPYSPPERTESLPEKTESPPQKTESLPEKTESSPEKTDAPLYVNDRISTGGIRQALKCSKMAPPIPKPRTKIPGQSPAKTQDSEMDGEKDVETPKTERFI